MLVNKLIDRILNDLVQLLVGYAVNEVSAHTVATYTANKVTENSLNLLGNAKHVIVMSCSGLIQIIVRYIDDLIEHILGFHLNYWQILVMV